MRIAQDMSNSAIAGEVGTRLRALRLQENRSQAWVARQAGISAKTVARLEHGEDTQVSALLGFLRALGALDSLEAAIPTAEPRPSAYLEGRAPRKRASRAASGDSTSASEKGRAGNPGWKWGDEQ